MTDPRLGDPETFRAIADDTYDWETWFDTDGVPRWINRAVQRMTGRSAAQCLALSDYPLPLIHPDDRVRMAQVLDGARAGSSGNDQEFRLLRDDGTEQWVAMSWQSTVSRRGERLGFRTSVRDIHDRKSLELELREALRVAETARRARDELVAMMSHELRTPLQVIQGYAELLRGLEPRADQQRPLELICVQTEQLSELLENVLELSALDAGAPRLKLQAVVIDELLAQVCDSFRPEAHRRGLELRFEGTRDERPVRADVRVLRQILGNLLHNALKFTLHGQVVLRALSESEPGTLATTLAIEVVDTGVGIDPAQLAQIFEPFVQAHDRQTFGDQGRGLGLAIARRLAEALGGTLRAQSEPGRGSVFRLRLPLQRAGRRDPRYALDQPSRAAEPITPALAERHPLRVMVVDDSAAARELLGEVLSRHGYAPTIANSGQEAVEQATQQAFDLILMDLSMPGLDGVQAMTRIRSASPQARAHTRIVALTAGVLPSQDSALIEQGFDGVLLKPVHLDRLQDLLRWAAEPSAAPAAGAGKSTGEHARAIPGASLRADVLADLRALDASQRASGARDGGLLRRVVERVRARLPEHRTALSSAVHDSDRSQLARACHALKGDCLVVGATACAEVAGRAERVASQPRSSRAARQRAVTELLHAIDGLEGELNRLLATP